MHIVCIHIHIVHVHNVDIHIYTLWIDIQFTPCKLLFKPIIPRQLSGWNMYMTTPYMMTIFNTRLTTMALMLQVGNNIIINIVNIKILFTVNSYKGKKYNFRVFISIVNIYLTRPQLKLLKRFPHVYIVRCSFIPLVI